MPDLNIPQKFSNSLRVAQTLLRHRLDDTRAPSPASANLRPATLRVVSTKAMQAVFRYGDALELSEREIVVRLLTPMASYLTVETGDEELEAGEDEEYAE